MRARWSPVVVSMLLSAVAVVAWAQQFSLRPGEYETTVEMRLPGAPEPMSHQALSCITVDEARDVTGTLKKMLAQEADCQISNERNSASTLDFDMVCVDGRNRSSIKVEMKFSSDNTYEQVATTTVDGEVITLKTTAKWLQATCSKESLDDDDE